MSLSFWQSGCLILRAYRQMHFIACYIHLCVLATEKTGQQFNQFYLPCSFSSQCLKKEKIKVLRFIILLRHHSDRTTCALICEADNFHHFTNLMQTHRNITIWALIQIKSTSVRTLNQIPFDQFRISVKI